MKERAPDVDTDRNRPSTFLFAPFELKVLVTSIRRRRTSRVSENWTRGGSGSGYLRFRGANWRANPWRQDEREGKMGLLATYLAALARVDAIVEAGSLVATHPAQHGGAVKF